MKEQKERDLSYLKEFKSKFFKLEDFTKCELAEQYGIENIPEYWNILGLNELCAKVLDPLRTTYGGPITIMSGYRSPAINRKFGGSFTSQHMSGTAADIKGITPYQTMILAYMLAAIPNLNFDQMIIHGWNIDVEPIACDYVHVSWAARPRYEIKIIDYKNKGERTSVENFLEKYDYLFSHVNITY